MEHLTDSIPVQSFELGDDLEDIDLEELDEMDEDDDENEEGGDESRPRKKARN